MIEFKSDNRGLFDYSLEAIPQAGWQIKAHTFDLHHSPMNEGNVMTEYEEKFSSMGNPICKLVAAREIPAYDKADSKKPRRRIFLQINPDTGASI